MIIIKLLKIIFVIKWCHAEFIPVFHPFKPHLPPLVPICSQPQHHHQYKIAPILKPSLENNTSLDSTKQKLKFLMPFLDMEIQHNRNLIIMRETFKQQIFILHGQELYQLFVSRQEKRLSLMGLLEGSVSEVEPLGAQIIYWQGNLILVVALDEHLEVFQLPEIILKERAEVVKNARAHAPPPPPIFAVIQQLTLTGKFQKLFLLSPAEERIMIIAAVNFTKLYGKYSSFEWLNTYFNPVEELIIPTIHVANVIGSNTKYFVIGRTIKHQSKTILTVNEISQTTLRLQIKQTLTVQSKVVHIFTHRTRNMIVACSSKDHKCSSFRQNPDGHFSVYRQRSSKEFAFDLLVSGKNFIAATRQNQITIFTNHRLDCYGSFIADQMHVSNLMGHCNWENENYILLVYKSAFKSLIRIIELEINVNDLATGNHSEPEEMLAAKHHEHLFETTVGQLRSVLLQRKMDMDVLRKISNIIKPKIKEFAAKKPVTLYSGNVGIIKIIGKNLRSPLQILEKVATLRESYITQRAKRSKHLANNVKVNKLKVQNLIYQEDVIKGFHLNETHKEKPILYIKPSVKTYAVNSTELLILPAAERLIRQQNIDDLFFNFTPTVLVKRIKVDFINGVGWNEFLDSLFLKNRDKMIQGALVMQSRVDVNHLETTVLNGFNVSNLFNLKHPQVVHSELMISRIFVRDLEAKTVNGLVFEEDIVFSGNDSLIETPVIMHQLKVSGNLILEDNTKMERSANNSSESELKQFYTNKVIINGSLILNNLIREKGHDTKIILGDEEYNENDIKNKYLLKEEAQNFSFPINLNESKVTAPSLETNYLNDHLTEQHMLVNVSNDDNPLLLVFMKALVQGDVICQDKSKIAEIKENIIRQDDKFVNISGIKIFEAPLEVNDINVLYLNHMPVEDLIFKSLLREGKLPLKFKNLKNFVKIKVKNPAFIAKQLEASYLNNLLLEDLLSNNYYMDRLQLPYLLETSNIVFHKINGIPFDEFFKKVNVKEERLVLHTNLIVEGNAEFKEPLEVQYLNNISWNAYVNNLVRTYENSVIEGDVTFANDLIITKEFATADVNGFDLELILNNILMKSKPQLISGLYYFDNINASNVNVLNINQVNVKEFIDLSQNFTEFKGDIIVENLYIQGNLQANDIENQNFNYLREQVKDLPLRPWKNIFVVSNASWPSNLSDNSQQMLLKYLYRTAVKANKDQIITGNIKFVKPLITNMHTRLPFPAHVDFDFIQQDGLFKNSSIPQIVKGKKVFLKPLYVNNLKAYNHIYAKLLNNVDILRFNQSLYRLTHPVPLVGPLKFFKPLVIKHLQVNGFINGLKPSLIYQLNSHTAVPALKLNELFIDNDLKIKNINDMNFEYFLDNYVTLKGPALEHFGTLTFENLVIDKKALIQNINNIAIDNLVFKHSDTLQIITGHKKIAKSLVLAGPAYIMRLNAEDLMEMYRKSLLRDQNYQFVNLLIDKATFQQDIQVVGNFTNNTQERTFAEFELLSLNNKKDLLHSLKELNKNLSFSKPAVIYVDYDLNLKIKWTKPENHQISNETILYELSRISFCEKVYLQISFQNSCEIYLQNITSNRLDVITNNISVKAENYCRNQHQKVKSKITISGHNLLKVFGMQRFIETMHIIDIDNSTDLLILHALDLPSLKRNEVRIFKIFKHNNSISDWQGLIENIGERLKLFNLPSLKILVTNGLSAHHHPALSIYHFNKTTQLFKLQQTIIGDYNIFEMLELPSAAKNTKHLIVSCSKCQRIFIYELNSSPKEGSKKYEIFQIIVLKSFIDKLVVFSLYDQFYMLVVSQRHSNFFNIYKYSYIQGWLHLTFGYFPNSQMAIPLTTLWSREGNLSLSYTSNGIPLLLLCNIHNCYLVKAIL